MTSLQALFGGLFYRNYGSNLCKSPVKSRNVKKEIIMWKIVVAFIVFAALALYLLSKGGDVDMSGEKHGAVSNVIQLVKT